jgi:predicted NAD/FAD-binding protein
MGITIHPSPEPEHTMALGDFDYHARRAAKLTDSQLLREIRAWNARWVLARQRHDDPAADTASDAKTAYQNERDARKEK